MKDNLKHRVMKAKASSIPENSLDRSRLLKSLMVTANKLENRKKETLNVISEATKEVRAINKDIKMVNKKLAALQPEEGELVTEHAILRYLERYMGLDLEKIHADILALPSADKTMANNTVITVYPEVDDHFNLAQNERK